MQTWEICLPSAHFSFSNTSWCSLEVCFCHLNPQGLHALGPCLGKQSTMVSQPQWLVQGQIQDPRHAIMSPTHRSYEGRITLVCYWLNLSPWFNLATLWKINCENQVSTAKWNWETKSKIMQTARFEALSCPAGPQSQWEFWTIPFPAQPVHSYSVFNPVWLHKFCYRQWYRALQHIQNFFKMCTEHML